MNRGQQEQLIARVSLRAKLELVPAVLSFVRETLVKMGLDSDQGERMALVTEEACVNVLEHSFDPGEPGGYQVEILRRPGQIVVALQDQGLPFDFREYQDRSESNLSIILMKAFADEVQFLNLGRNGKRVELIKNLPYQSILDQPYQSGEQATPSAAPLAEDSQIIVREAQPGDSVDLARLVYRCYGPTYPADYIYFPDKFREFLESGLLLAYVALSPDGEIIGHISLRKNYPDARVGDGGQAVVDPRYRGRGFLGKLILSFAEYAFGKGIYGAYSEAVAVHPFSQKASLAIGGYETGVLLGFIPVNVLFRKIGGEHLEQRQSVVLLYTSGNLEPERDVYPPPQHEAIIREIYSKGRLKRNIIPVPGSPDQTAMTPRSEVNVKVQADVGQAYMQVVRYGEDFGELVRFRLKELCLRRIDCLYIDLPLSDPGTRQWVAALEELGFFFGGIIPELYEGDVLRLQYLNNVGVARNDIQTASDFGGRLADYVIKAGGF